jgi:F-type H+-transporting ATPase subunit b
MIYNLRLEFLNCLQFRKFDIKEQSLKDIELAKLKAVQELQAQVVDLSVMIAGQILQKKVRSEDHAEFVKEEIAKLKNMKA